MDVHSPVSDIPELEEIEIRDIIFEIDTNDDGDVDSSI